MPTGPFYRGGNNLKPKPREVLIDRATGFVLPARGVSVSISPAGLHKFGGPHLVTNVPPELWFVKTSRDPNHYEIAPADPMPMTEYEEALNKIILVPVSPTAS